MKIAVTYDNGEIFQHFGKTESFKVYEVEANKVVSSEVIGSNGTGHGALAGLLAEQGVNVLICGGIGGGAQTALTEAGIELCAGAQGNTDQAVENYLKGELVSSGANCDHHHHEEGHSCGSHEEGHSCGDSCGGGCGGCGGSQPQLTGRNVGKTCRTHYRGTFNDGTQFDSSYDRGWQSGGRYDEGGRAAFIRILCARFDRHCIAALREALYCSNNRERKSTRNLRKHG